MAEQGKGPVDTSHLYEGKVVRSSAPSRKKAAGEMKRDTGIPDDAVPEVALHNWINNACSKGAVPVVTGLNGDMDTVGSAI